MSSKTFNVLFLCSGNSCRSPMAEGLLKAKIPEKYKGSVNVVSAGTLGINGSPATQFAVQIARELGADISQHRSQGISSHLAKKIDIIFAMAPEHQEFMQRRYPNLRENVFLLRSFGRGIEEKINDKIEDPIGGTLEDYRNCGELINSELDRIMPRLEQLIEEKLN